MASTRPVSVPIHIWMIAYDVADNQRRQRLARALLGYGERIQYSVFECRLDARELVRLRRRILEIIDPESDSIRWYPLCRPCHGRVARQGQGERSEDEGFYLV